METSAAHATDSYDPTDEENDPVYMAPDNVQLFHYFLEEQKPAFNALFWTDDESKYLQISWEERIRKETSASQKIPIKTKKNWVTNS